jgi:hypothetical protein
VKRLLLKTLLFLSLLLFIGVVALWVLSYRRIDSISRYPYFPATREYCQEAVRSSAGRLWVSSNRFSIADNGLAARMAKDSSEGGYDNAWSHELFGDRIYPDDARWWERAGPYVRTWRGLSPGMGGTGSVSSGYAVAVPYWNLAVVALLLPGTLLVRRLRSRRSRHMAEVLGLCVECGYDLRESGGRCPECGTTVAHAAATG